MAYDMMPWEKSSIFAEHPHLTRIGVGACIYIELFDKPRLHLDDNDKISVKNQRLLQTTDAISNIICIFVSEL